MHQNDNETARVVNLAGFVSLCFTVPRDLDEFTPVVRLFIARWSRSPFSQLHSRARIPTISRTPSTIYIFGSLRNDYRQMLFLVEGWKKLVPRGATVTKSAQLRGNFEKQPSVGCVEPTAWCFAFLRLLPVLRARGCVWVVKRAKCRYSLAFISMYIFNNDIAFLSSFYHYSCRYNIRSNLDILFFRKIFTNFDKRNRN